MSSAFAGFTTTAIVCQLPARNCSVVEISTFVANASQMFLPYPRLPFKLRKVKAYGLPIGEGRALRRKRDPDYTVTKWSRKGSWLWDTIAAWLMIAGAMLLALGLL